MPALFSTIVFYLYSSNLSFLVPLSHFFLNLKLDSFSLFIVILLTFIFSLVFLYQRALHSSKEFYFTLFVLYIFCFISFSTDNFFLFYVCYEASLLPIFYIIVKWGSYRDRSVSAFMLLFYTIFFGAPFFLIIIHLLLSSPTFLFRFLNVGSYGLVSSLIMFLAFAVKLPIYGLHFWLPIAHVEAPTFGSVILASVLLKLGGVGIYRFSDLINISCLNSILLAYFIVFLVYVSFVCCYQSDMKRLIAYSSVSHIITLPFLFLSSRTLSFQALLLVIFFHGLRSSLLFFYVGEVSIAYSTRQLISLRGYFIISPLIRFYIILTFFFTISAPPFPSFFAEVLFLISSYVLRRKLLFGFGLFIFLSLVYNLNWLLSLGFFGSSNHLPSVSQLNYPFFLVTSFILIFSFFIIPFFMFV